jgi:hypothetical protein
MSISLSTRLTVTTPQVLDVAIDGTVPDLNIGTAVIVRITAASNGPILAGINDITPDRVVCVQNVSGATVSVVFGSPAANPANRFKEGSGTVNLLNTTAMMFAYRAPRWVLLARS